MDYTITLTEAEDLALQYVAAYEASKAPVDSEQE